MEKGPPEGKRSDDDSQTSDFDSATVSDKSGTESSQGSFAGSEKIESTQSQSPEDINAGVLSTLQCEKPIVAVLSKVTPDRQLVQPHHCAERGTLPLSSEILRGLSQTALGFSSSEVAQLAHKTSQVPQQTAEQHDAQSVSSVSKQRTGAEETSACTKPPALYQVTPTA
jgi:hypothetical protein